MNEFQERHPLAIDIGEGYSIRFGDLLCAARTALDRRLPIWDEQQGKAISVEECRKLVNARG